MKPVGKILRQDELKHILQGLKAQGKRLVFTNGCFDIIHIGHVRYLREAKTLGDLLVVGINSDRSVSITKPDRPVNSQDQRAEVLASLEMVDYVTIWKKEDIIGSDIAKETHSLPYIEGISTTGIIEKIKKI
jgi:D-beta-D-heptose 7-phosphate kinase/D-beta-D-heptose 1-phosphate adenosyltransferase